MKVRTTSAPSAVTTRSQTKEPYRRTVDSTKFTDLGTLRVRKNSAGEEKLYVVVEKDVEISVNGQKVDLGEYRTINLLDPRVGLEKMFSNGTIDEEKYNERLQIIEDKNIEYKLTVPPKN